MTDIQNLNIKYPCPKISEWTTVFYTIISDGCGSRTVGSFECQQSKDCGVKLSGNDASNCLQKHCPFYKDLEKIHSIH